MSKAKVRAAKLPQQSRVESRESNAGAEPTAGTAPLAYQSKLSQVAKLMEIPRASILPSPTNPRKFFDATKLAELAESIARLGIQQPLIVRPLPKYELNEPDMIEKCWRITLDGKELMNVWPVRFMEEDDARAAFKEYSAKQNGCAYELVAGERRWRAAELARLDRVPALVRELTDTDVLEIQYIENLQRQDLTPMEEAEGFRKLIDSGRYTVNTLAERTGIKRSTIFARMALMKLAPAVIKALREEKIPHTIGQLIGTIPGVKLQEEALEEIAPVYSQAMSFREAKKFIAADYQVDLSTAHFSRKEIYQGIVEGAEWKPQLVTRGACLDCPRRSENCRDEFPDIASPSVCTDPACFKAKCAAHTLKLLAEAKAKGVTILSEDEAEAAFSYGTSLNHRSPFVKPEEICRDDKKQRTFERLLGKEAPPKVLAVREGKIVELYRKADIAPTLKEEGFKLESEAGSSGSYGAEDRKRAEKKKKMLPVAYAATEQILAKLIPGTGIAAINPKLWPRLVDAVFGQTSIDAHTFAAKRRGLAKTQGEARPALEEWANTHHEPMECARMMVELLLCAMWNGGYDPQWSTDFKELCELVGVDLKQIAKDLENPKSKIKNSATPPPKKKQSGVKSK